MLYLIWSSPPIFYIFSLFFFKPCFPPFFILLFISYFIFFVWLGYNIIQCVLSPLFCFHLKFNDLWIIDFQYVFLCCIFLILSVPLFSFVFCVCVFFVCDFFPTVLLFRLVFNFYKYYYYAVLFYLFFCVQNFERGGGIVEGTLYLCWKII